MRDVGSYFGPVIDAHHHLWMLADDRYPWLRPADSAVSALGNLESLRTDYLPDHYVLDMEGCHLAASVHVEALHEDPLDEIAWLDTLDKRCGVALRYVSAGNLEETTFNQTARQLSAHGRVTGVRSILSWHPNTELSFVSDPFKSQSLMWRKGVEELARFGLALELMLYPYQAEQVARLAADFPELTIIINHCASPIDRDAAGLARWKAGLEALAEQANIRIKASNPGTYAGREGRDGSIQMIRQCVDSFGSDRSMYGTDFPVSKLNRSPEELLGIFQLATAHLSADEQSNFFFNTANSIYKLELEEGL